MTGFPGEVVATGAPDEQVHVILDSVSTHKTKLVEAFLDEHPNVTLHFTPTYSLWLNQVEFWFSKVQRDVLSRGIFTSTADLARKPRAVHRRLRAGCEALPPGSGPTPRGVSPMGNFLQGQTTSGEPLGLYVL